MYVKGSRCAYEENFFGAIVHFPDFVITIIAIWYYDTFAGTRENGTDFALISQFSKPKHRVGSKTMNILDAFFKTKIYSTCRSTGWLDCQIIFIILQFALIIKNNTCILCSPFILPSLVKHIRIELSLSSPNQETVRVYNIE